MVGGEVTIREALFTLLGGSFHLSYEERAVAAFFPAVNALRRTSGSTWDDAEISSEYIQGKRKPFGIVWG